MRRFLVATFLILMVVCLSARPARAAEPRCELGTSLVSAIIGLGDDYDTKTFGIPTGSILGIGSPGAYGAFFFADRFGVEPQLRLFVISRGDTSHVVSFNGQVDYFLKGTATRSVYLFGKAGIVDFDSDDTHPKVVGGGIGYRIPIERLVLRFDGQLLHYTDDVGNALVLGVSIGGLFW